MISVPAPERTAPCPGFGKEPSRSCSRLSARWCTRSLCPGKAPGNRPARARHRPRWDCRRVLRLAHQPDLAGRRQRQRADDVGSSDKLGRCTGGRSVHGLASAADDTGQRHELGGGPSCRHGWAHRQRFPQPPDRDRPPLLRDLGQQGLLCGAGTRRLCRARCHHVVRCAVCGSRMPSSRWDLSARRSRRCLAVRRSLGRWVR